MHFWSVSHKQRHIKLKNRTGEQLSACRMDTTLSFIPSASRFW